MVAFIGQGDSSANLLAYVVLWRWNSALYNNTWSIVHLIRSLFQIVGAGGNDGHQL